MSRKKGSRKSRTRGRHGPHVRPAQPPSVRLLLAVWLPLAALAVLLDWMCYQYAILHRKQHGHLNLPMSLVIIALFFSSAGITIPCIWLWHRRQ